MQLRTPDAILRTLDAHYSDTLPDYQNRKNIRRCCLEKNIGAREILDLLKLHGTPVRGVLSFLPQYHSIYHSRTIQEPHRFTDLESLPFPHDAIKEMTSRLVLHLNRRNGKGYETSFAAIVMKGILETSQGVQNLTVVHDREVRSVRHKDGIMRRRFDLYFPELAFAVEVKSGRVTLTRDVRQQVAVDERLVHQDDLSGCLWFLAYGASPTVLDRLDSAGLEFIDISWPRRSKRLMETLQGREGRERVA